MKNHYLATCLLSAIMIAGCGDKAKSTMPESSSGTPASSASNASKFTESELGLPYYPGATELTGETMKIDYPTEKSYLISFTTPDEVDAVTAFYKDKVKGIDFNTMEGSGAKTAFSKDGFLLDGWKVSMTVMRKKGESTTKITLGKGKIGK